MKSLRSKLTYHSVLSIVLVATMCLTSSLVANAHFQRVADASPLQPLAANQPAKVPKVTTAPTVVAQPVAARGTQAGGPVQTCIPAEVTTPGAVDLNGVSGLKQQIDSPQQYQIYGNDNVALRQQIRSCGLKTGGADAAEFTAETLYQLTWRYQIQDFGDGRCALTGAAVGIHVSQIMPLWQPTSAAQAGLANRWNSFAAALATHENGHTAINVRYAQTLLDDLNNFPPIACDQLEQAVKHLTDHDVAVLEQANDNYDSTTDHGMTQGAVLPQ